MNYIDPTGHFLGSLFAWVGKVVVGGIVNAVVDTGIRLLTGQEVSLKTVGRSFVEGCVSTAIDSGVSKLVGKAVGAIRNGKKAAKVVKTVDKVDDKVAGISKTSVDKAITAKRTSKVVSTAPSRSARYFTKTSELNKHYAKHGKKVAKSLGKSRYTKRNYLNDARYIVKSGKYVQEKNAYVKFIGGIGEAKFGFVGVTRDGKYITTFHITTIGKIIKFTSLGYKK